jgi:hypothetical protein
MDREERRDRRAQATHFEYPALFVVMCGAEHFAVTDPSVPHR